MNTAKSLELRRSTIPSSIGKLTNLEDLSPGTSRLLVLIFA